MNLEKFHFVTRFLEQVQKYQDREAVRFRKNGLWASISWKELDKNVRAIANALVFNKIEETENIGIFSPNTPQWTMIDIAAGFIRACAVPIYATNTADQASHIINDANIQFLFVGEQEQYDKAVLAKEKCPKLKQIIAINDAIVLKENHFSVYLKDFVIIPDEKEYEKEVEKRLSRRNLKDIYTIIYTSGTTGAPKGVIIDYENVAYQFINHDVRLKVEEGKKSMSFLPLSHVYERTWLAYVLHKGVINCYLDDTNKVADALKEVQPHYMCVVPRLLEKIYTKIYENVTKQSIFKRFIFSFVVKNAKKAIKAKQENKKISFFTQKILKFGDKKVFQKLRQALGGNIEMIPCGGATLEPSIGLFFHAIGVNVKLGYGMTETTATISCWNDQFNSASVGTILPNIQVKIGENNEILVKGGSVTKGYYNNPEETAKSFTEDGFLRTGDAGNIDENGNIFITDRIKELMKTSNGKYIAPQQIEGKVGKDSFIEQIAIIADTRRYVSALIVPNYEALVEYAKELNLKYKNYSDLIKNTDIIEFFNKRLQHLQRELPNYEKIKKFTLLTSPFTIDRDELTPTLKLKRKNIYRNYFREIEAMYV